MTAFAEAVEIATMNSPDAGLVGGGDIRTFRAANTRAALAAIRAALGGDAIILQTREVGSMFGKAQIEVTAARPGLLDERRPGPEAAALTTLGLKDGDSRSQGGTGRVGDGGDSSVQGNPAQTGRGHGPERSEVFWKLVRRGVDEDLAIEIVEEARRHGAGSRPGELRDEVRALIGRRMRPAPAPWHAADLKAGPRRRIIALLGPTGVGKTTTVAKIAARALIETRLKVALITVDNYRVGGSEQLARYGKIMGVRVHVARDVAALADAAAAAPDADLIVIDTAGRSDAAGRAEQVALLRSLPDVELHLVLSAATGAREIAAMARRYGDLAPERLIFSKLDESDGPGSVLSATAALARPISCITDGQRVPEDIHAVSAHDLQKLVFVN